MQVLYFIFSVFTWLISILPFRLLYILSDFFYFIIFYIVRYRKNVVFNNLRNSFPEKSEAEIKKIAKKYFHNLCDIIIETFKVKGITEKQLNKRVKIKNIELFDELYKSGKSVIIASAHLGNWEFTTHIFTVKCSYYEHYAIIKPLSNEYFNNFANKIRTKFRLNLVPYKQILKFMVKNKNVQSIYYNAADQTPAKGEINYWATFLNQDTPFYNGIEKLAKSFDLPIVFMNVQRIKRGFYEIEFTKFTDNPKELKENEITDWYVKNLENIIKNNPDNWLWSHKRWKHKKLINNS